MRALINICFKIILRRKIVKINKIILRKASKALIRSLKIAKAITRVKIVIMMKMTVIQANSQKMRANQKKRIKRKAQ